MSDSVRPHPWDSPGENTGVGCHFLLQRIKVKSESEVTQSCPTLHDPMDCSLAGSSVHGIFQARVLEWGAIAFSNTSLKELKFHGCWIQLGFSSGSDGYESACNAGDSVWSLEKGMATHSSIIAWRIPWTEKSDQLQSMGSQRVRQDWVTNNQESEKGPSGMVLQGHKLACFILRIPLL